MLLGLENAKERDTREGSEKKKLEKGKKALSYSYNTVKSVACGEL